eukprot:g52.t1
MHKSSTERSLQKVERTSRTSRSVNVDAGSLIQAAVTKEELMKELERVNQRLVLALEANKSSLTTSLRKTNWMLNRKREKKMSDIWSMSMKERSTMPADIPTVPYVRAAKQGWRETLDSSAMQKGMGVGMMPGYAQMKSTYASAAAQDNVSQSYRRKQFKIGMVGREPRQSEFMAFANKAIELGVNLTATGHH